MKFRTRSKVHIGLESVALADIVMNLFIFFFITFSLLATFQRKPESPLRVSLPSVSKGTGETKPASHEILLTRSGEILWNQTPIAVEKLKARLSDQKTKRERVDLRADRGASVQALVRILEAVRDSGATNVSLQTVISDKV